MKKSLIYLTILFLSLLMFSSCLSDPLAFDIVESPVKMEFDGPDLAAAQLIVNVVAMELDKTDILDKDIGIVETPINGLTIKVYINEDELVEEITTDGEGKATLTTDWEKVSSVSKLEWTGTYNDTAFRIYQNF